MCVCVCLPGTPSGSWPALQVHHPGIAGPHQGGVSVSPGTVPQVDNTQTRTFTSRHSLMFQRAPVSSYVCVICPPTVKPHPNHNRHNEQLKKTQPWPQTSSCSRHKHQYWPTLWSVLGMLKMIGGHWVGPGFHKSLLIFAWC